MCIEDKIKQTLLERYPNADDVELDDPNEGVLWVRVTFFSDDDINYIVIPYLDECLDFFKFEFSKERGTNNGM